jgi:hypothetical protein
MRRDAGVSIGQQDHRRDAPGGQDEHWPYHLHALRKSDCLKMGAGAYEFDANSRLQK